VIRTAYDARLTIYGSGSKGGSFARSVSKHQYYHQNSETTQMRNILLLTILITLFACERSELYDDITLDEFILEDGFRIELVAAEPLLDSPMDMAWDDEGRIWVAEMPGYMRDLEGTDEYRPDGRIVILEDTDGNGQMDQRTVFLDSLVLPRSLALVYGGLLYVETPSLYWVSIEGDKPGRRELVDSNYVRGGNIEHQPNGLLYNLDHWIYSAKSQHRYQRKNGKWVKEATAFRGQWGITHDDQGRLYYNDNSNTLFGDHVPPNVLHRNPYQKVQNAYQQNICPDRRVYPVQATAVNRGYQDGVLDPESQKLQHFTSACGPLIYRGSQFPEAYYGNAFVCGPEVNLIKRAELRNEGGKVVGSQAYAGREFLISRDETFRPINLYNGPDGAMYVLDLRKGVIQHRAYMTRYLRDKIVNKGLQDITGLGRIYRITHSAKSAEAVDLPGDDVTAWTDLLDHPDAWVRERAMRWVTDHGEQDISSQLGSELLTIPTLNGLGTLQSDQLVQLTQTADPDILAQALFFAERLDSEQITTLLPSPDNLTEGLLRPASAYAAGVLMRKSGSIPDGWLRVLDDAPLLQEAFISGLDGAETLLLPLLPEGSPFAQKLENTLANRELDMVQAPQVQDAPVVDSRDRAARLYALHCGSCHGPDGKGFPSMAPPLYQSEYIAGDPKVMTLISLQGMKGPITVRGQTYEFAAPMPGYKDNPQLTDKDLADILSFIRNGFGTDPSTVSVDLVKDMRKQVQDWAEPFTEEELRRSEVGDRKSEVGDRPSLLRPVGLRRAYRK